MRSIRVFVALTLALSLPNIALAGTLAQVPPAPAAAAPSGPEAEDANLTEEEKGEKAKGLYMQAEGLAAEGNWVDAVVLYEKAYYLVPGKHGFAHKVGVAAWYAKDCDKANEYLKHFLTYAEEDKYADKFAEAKQILGEISVSGCASDSGTTTTTTTTTAVAEDDENPVGMSTTEARQQENRTVKTEAANEKRGLLIGGAVLLSVGVVGLGVGVTGLALASSSANSLQELSTNLTQSGFPEGDYSCRDSGAPCPYDIEKRMKVGNVLGGVGLGVGGAALIGGAAMLAIYMINKKKNGGATESAPTDGAAGVELSAVGPMLVPGGGAGAMAEIRF